MSPCSRFSETHQEISATNEACTWGYLGFYFRSPCEVLDCYCAISLTQVLAKYGRGRGRARLLRGDSFGQGRGGHGEQRTWLGSRLSVETPLCKYQNTNSQRSGDSDQRGRGREHHVKGRGGVGRQTDRRRKLQRGGQGPKERTVQRQRREIQRERQRVLDFPQQR